MCVCVCVCIQYMCHCFGKKTTSTSISHSASYNITCNHHYHHLDHHSTNYNACIQYMWHRFRKKTTTTAITQCKLQLILRPTTTAITSTTTAPVTMHAFSICATALGKKQTTSASYCGLGPAGPPAQVTEGQKLHCHHWRARCSKHL